MWTPSHPIKPYNASCSDCGISAEIAGRMRRGLCHLHYERRKTAGTLPPVAPYPPRRPRKPNRPPPLVPEPGHDRHSLARRERRRRIAAARLARVGLPLRVEPGEMPRPAMPNNSRAWASGKPAKLT